MNRSTALPRLAWAGIAFVGTLLPISGFADDQDVRDYRSHVMKTLGEQFAALNQITKGKAPAADIATQAEVLSITASVAKVAFTPKVLGGESKPEVWDKWDDFSKRLDDMVAAAADVAKAAKQGGVPAVTPKLSSLSCKGCHDVYRVAKK
ncbi:c-type cytochrome [Steroidobacter cummioxidans]|uniref:c-type cytochrome n=1 Tax=Steroidobacter cummioxidans TaxID=1803913 RepID=UPI00129029FF|nr:cytochrome c [Steroidobacter cummioxidans]